MSDAVTRYGFLQRRWVAQHLLYFSVAIVTDCGHAGDT